MLLAATVLRKPKSLKRLHARLNILDARIEQMEATRKGEIVFNSPERALRTEREGLLREIKFVQSLERRTASAFQNTPRGQAAIETLVPKSVLQPILAQGGFRIEKPLAKAKGKKPASNKERSTPPSSASSLASPSGLQTSIPPLDPDLTRWVQDVLKKDYNYDPSTAQSLILTPEENARRAKRSGSRASKKSPQGRAYAAFFSGRRFSHDPFARLPFTQEAFQAVIDAPFPQPVQTRLGGTIPYDQASRLVSQATGLTSFAITRQDDLDEDEAQQAYDAFGATGVGKTVGFNRGQKDRQVPRAGNEKELFAKTHYKNGHKITQSERLRDSVNEMTKSGTKLVKPVIKGALMSPLSLFSATEEQRKVWEQKVDPVAEFGSGMIASAVTGPLDMMTEFRTIFDPEETPENIAGATFNLVFAVATDGASKWAGPAFKKVFKAIKESPALLRAPRTKQRLIRLIGKAMKKGGLPDQATIERILKDAEREAQLFRSTIDLGPGKPTKEGAASSIAGHDPGFAPQRFHFASEGTSPQQRIGSGGRMPDSTTTPPGRKTIAGSVPPINRRRASWVPAPKRQTNAPSALDSLLNVFQQAGAFRSNYEKAAARYLWQLRAHQWARETGRPEAEFYAGLKSQLDGPVPKRALRQSVPEGVPEKALAKYSDLEELNGFRDENGNLKVSFVNADRAMKGNVLTPSGAATMTHGGQRAHLEGVDNKIEFGTAWPVSTKKLAKGYIDRAKAGTRLHVTVSNSPENVLGSHGVLSIPDIVDHAVLTGIVTEQDMFAHILSSVRHYNSLSAGRTKPIPLPQNIGQFVKMLRDDPLLISSFKGRGLFAETFFPKKNSRILTSPFPFDHTHLAESLNDDIPVKLGKKTSSVLGFLHIDPTKDIIKTTHPIYKFAAPGKNLGFALRNSLLELAPNEIGPAIQKFVKKNGRDPRPEELENAMRQWLVHSRQKSFLIDPKDLGNFFVHRPKDEEAFQNLAHQTIDESKVFQRGKDGVAKAWYDVKARTIGARKGKSDFSSFVHESFHDWRQTLTEPHVQTLERHFGKRGSIDFEERSAAAFERYLRDGLAPHPELRQIFETIKTAMIRVYESIVGTPLEDAVHPEIRRTFDEMLGFGNSGEARLVMTEKRGSPASGKARTYDSGRAVSPSGLANRRILKQDRVRSKRVR